MGSKKQESKQLAQVARKLVYISGEAFTAGISVYALAIKEAMKAVGATNYSGSPRAFIKNHLSVLEDYCVQNSKVVAEAKRTRKSATPLKIQQKSDAYKAGQILDVSSTEFLETFAWRKLRMEALIKYGRRCVCCGATPQTGAIMNVDHIKPRKFFPDLALDISNLQILCHECNHGKGNWDQTDWR